MIYAFGGATLESVITTAALDNGQRAEITKAKLRKLKDLKKCNNKCDRKNVKDKKTTTKKSLKKGCVFRYKNAKYRITGSRTVEFFRIMGKKKTITVPDSIQYKHVKYKVTSIASSACARKTKIKKVSIGKNVSKIGAKAFYHCKNLKLVTIRTKKLNSKKIGKKAWKGIPAKAVFKVPAKKKTAYKKWIRSNGASKKTRVKQQNTVKNVEI